jgi:hypothetical protein
VRNEHSRDVDPGQRVQRRSNLKEALELSFEEGSRPDVSELPIIASVNAA